MTRPWVYTRGFLRKPVKFQFSCFGNFKSKQGLAKQSIHHMLSLPQLLPCVHQPGDNVTLDFWETKIHGSIYGVHFYQSHLHDSRTKYDIELLGEKGETTRIYNVDGKFVFADDDWLKENRPQSI